MNRLLASLGLTFALSFVVACADPPLETNDDSLPVCTKQVYDRCEADTDCDSGMCHLFNGSGFSSCTTACSASQPCPMQEDGSVGVCNNKGICKPAAPNECKL